MINQSFFYFQTQIRLVQTRPMILHQDSLQMHRVIRTRRQVCLHSKEASLTVANLDAPPVENHHGQDRELLLTKNQIIITHVT